MGSGVIGETCHQNDHYKTKNTLKEESQGRLKHLIRMMMRFL